MAEALKPWQRPAFEKGNLAGTTHGAKSKTLMERAMPAIVREIHDILLTLDWADPMDTFTMERGARYIYQLRAYDKWADDNNDGHWLSQKGVPLPAWKMYLETTKAFDNWIKSTGMSPLARAELRERLGLAALQEHKSTEASQKRLMDSLDADE